MSNAHKCFWSQHPALLVGLSFLFGIGAALFDFPIWLLLLWAVYLLFLRRWAALCLIPLASCYAYLLLGNLPELEAPLSCTARFSIASLQPHKTPFHQDLIYKGTLYVENKMVPCTVVWKQKERLIASSDYEFTGELHQRGPYDYLFKVQEYTPIPNTWSLAELRYLAKEKLRTFLKTKLTRPRTALLLSSLATGDVEDRMLRFEFGRLGLQHLLAISGFHFGVLLAFLAFLFGLFLPHRWKWSAMLLLMSAYFFFIGASPAVQRAWISASLFLAGKIFRRPASPLNLLGAALFLELAWDPLVAANLGFQLSFGCCFGILLLYQPIEQYLRRFLPRRPTGKTVRLSPLSQLLFVGSSTFRSALGLTFAVNAAILPLLFHHFGRFPLLSLLYNLFFPFLISLALFGLLAALLFTLLIPPLAKPIFALLDWFTAQLLDLTTYPPLLLDHSLYCPEFPAQLIPLYLFLLFAFSLNRTRPENNLVRI